MARMLATRPVVGEPSRSTWRPAEVPAPMPRPSVPIFVLRLPLLAVLLAAFWLRMRELGAKSLWLDEGISVIFALDGVPGLFKTLAERDLHPPLYYLALYGWMVVGGQSETSVRFPSVLAGILLIAAVHRFAGQLYDGWVATATGLLAAAILAWSPFLLFHAQEARMYGPLALAGVGATCALWSGLARGGARRWGAYAVLLAAAPYTHLFGWLVVAAHGAFVLLSLPRLRRRALGWAAAIGLAVLLYLPWFPSSVRQVVRLRDTPDFWQGALSLWFVVQRAFSAFAVGFGGALEQYPLALLLFAGAFAVGAGVIAARGLLGGRPGDLLLVLYLVVPLVALYAVVARNPKFDARYLIVALPPFALLLARGLVAIGELGLRLRQSAPALGVGLATLAAALSVGVVVVSAGEADRVYWDEPYKKDDFRGTVDYLIGRWQPGDSVLLMIDTWQAFDYYAHGLIGPRHGFGPTDDLEFVAARLNAIVQAGHPRLWVVFWNPDWADPTGSIRSLLDETATRVEIDNPGARGLPLRLYSLADRPTFIAHAEPARRLDTTVGERLRLIGVDGDLAAPVPAGSSRRLTLHWQPLKQIAEDLHVSFRLVGRGQEWWRNDTRPAAYTWPTIYWRPERVVRGSHQIGVPAGTPPGRYAIEAVVYDGATGLELPTEGGRLALGELTVVPPAQPPPLSALPIAPRPTPVALGGVSLVALDPLPSVVDVGGRLRFAAGWRVEASASPAVDVWVRDAAGRVWPLSSDAPAGSDAWAAGDVLVDRRELVLPPGAAAGRAVLLVGARAASESPVPERAAAVAELELRSRARAMQPPSVQRPVEAALGDHAALIGADHAAAVERGTTLPVRLYWRSRAETRTSYAVFVHLVGADDRPIAQHDGVPGAGTLPTTGWLPGEYVTDEHVLAIPATAAPGEYRLLVGMYDQRTGQRAPVVLSAGRAPADRAPLDLVTVR
jgi:mannosyltransferase